MLETVGLSGAELREQAVTGFRLTSQAVLQEKVGLL